MSTRRPPLSDRGVVEAFHLLFLRALLASPTEKAHLTVKGGCNLRFFFGSVRYSEDLDLDVSIIHRGTLQKNVEKTLLGPVLGRSLRVIGVGVGRFNAAKQTETTQRWKIQLQTEGGGSVPTKIEFSRRGGEGEAELAAVERRLLDRYQLPPVHARHYLVSAATRQKVEALAKRDVAQARDVFDLDLLLTRTGPAGVLAASSRAVARAARDRALGLSYEEYVAQVVAYLEPEEQEIYLPRSVWETMQLHVVDALEQVGP